MAVRGANLDRTAGLADGDGIPGERHLDQRKKSLPIRRRARLALRSVIGHPGLAAVDVIWQANQWLGVRENPPGTNHVDGITNVDGFSDGAWCDMSVSRWITDAGLYHHCAWVPAEVQNAQEGYEGYTIVAPEDIQPGDLLCHDLGESIKYAHIDLVESRDGDPLVCIDGNWGNACVRVWRNVTDYSIQNGAVVRPPYAGANPTPAPIDPTPTPIPVPQEDPDMPGLNAEAVAGSDFVDRLYWRYLGFPVGEAKFHDPKGYHYWWGLTIDGVHTPAQIEAAFATFVPEVAA